jgi:hypothetical protein
LVSLDLARRSLYSTVMAATPDYHARSIRPVERRSFTSSVSAWLRLAAHPATVSRAFVTALVVGFVLIAVNHGAAILSGQLTRSRVIQMCLTVIVPYVVSTVSSVATRKELGAGDSSDEQLSRNNRNA